MGLTVRCLSQPLSAFPARPSPTRAAAGAAAGPRCMRRAARLVRRTSTRGALTRITIQWRRELGVITMMGIITMTATMGPMATMLVVRAAMGVMGRHGCPHGQVTSQIVQRRGLGAALLGNERGGWVRRMMAFCRVAGGRGVCACWCLQQAVKSRTCLSWA